MKKSSLTNRLTLLFAGASAAMLLGLGLLISHLVEHHFDELDVEALTGKLQLAQQVLAGVRTPADLTAVAAKLDAALVGHPGMALVVHWPDNATLLSASGAAFPRDVLERMPQGDNAVMAHAVNWDGRPYLRMVAKASLAMADTHPATVQVALDISHHAQFIDRFQVALWGIVGLAAILIGLLGRLVVRRGLAPLAEIRQNALAITANRLHQRLDSQAIPAELAELVQSLNTMLCRLEEAFQRLSDFSSDLAHELRTPVSNLLMQTQVTLSKTRSAADYREILYSNAEEFTRLSRMIADMLFLAKTDHGLVVPCKESVEVAAEVSNLFTYFDVLAESKSVTLAVDGEGRVCGDRMLLRRAISNLLSNAIRHSFENGQVRVNLAPTTNDEILLISVENMGVPIAPEHIPRLFDRFYRADPARATATNGVGLGLAITKSIISLHGGKIRVHSDGERTRFEVLLPCCRGIGACNPQREALAAEV